MQRRRLFLCAGLGMLAGELGWPKPAAAQAARPGGTPRVAWVSMERPNPEAPFLVAFRQGLRESGRVEGRSVFVEPMWADGSAERLRQQIIPQLLAHPPEVVVATSVAVRLLAEANLPMPMVFSFSGDPVVGGIVNSWARPGVNRTGVSYFSLELVPKRLELMREMLPHLRRLAIVGWPPHSGEQLELQAAQAAADRLGMVHQYHGGTSAAQVDAAWQALEAWRADAIMVFAGVVALAHAERFAAFAARSRIPSASAWMQFAQDGNLMSHGPVQAEGQVRMAAIVDRLLRGDKAAEIAVEGPTRIELVLNLRAALALGIDVPRTILLRADQVIE